MHFALRHDFVVQLPLIPGAAKFINCEIGQSIYPNPRRFQRSKAITRTSGERMVKPLPTSREV